MYVVERRGRLFVRALDPRHAPAPKATRVTPPKPEAPRVHVYRERCQRAALLSGAHEGLRGPKERGDCVGAQFVECDAARLLGELARGVDVA